MKNKILIIAFLLMSSVSAWAEDFDFSAVCGTGQTLYYIITSESEPYTVKVICPKEDEGEFYVGYSKPEGDLVIPSEVENNGIKYSVKGIGEKAFCACGGLTSVSFPESITNIADYAFYGCYGLKSVTIPNSVASIGGWAFTNCSGLTSIAISNSVTSIGDLAFGGCDGLVSITIPKTVEKMGILVFEKCTATIYCEAESKPKDWGNDWLGDEEYKGKIVWGYKPTPVTEFTANSVNVYAHGNTIEVENATDEISVYDAMGRLVCRDVARNVSTVAESGVRAEIRVNNPGLYIVKVGDVAKRVVVR